jgi:hypothetical protein
MSYSSPITSSECNGCEHRKLLDEQLDWLTVDHDDLRQDILERISTPKYHPSMAVIDQWEEESIAHIRQMAVLARRTLIDALDQHVFEVNKTLNRLTPKLREARDRVKPFNQNDIREWATALQKLKQIPMFPVTVDEDIHIPGLTIDLRQETRTYRSESKCDDLTPITTSTRTEYPIVPINFSKKINIGNKEVKFDNVPSSRSHKVTSEGLIIIRDSSKLNLTPKSIRRAHTETPLDSRITSSLHRPATVYPYQ